MKLLHISDLHIDSPLSSRLDASLVGERRRELLASARRAVTFGIEQGARAVLIAGDLFDHDEVSERAMSLTRDIIESFPAVPFFYVQGNHEGDALEKAANKPKNLYTFGRGFSCYDLDGVRIYGRVDTARDMFSALELDRSKKNILLMHGELRERSDAGGIIGLSELAHKGVDYLALGHYHSYHTEPIVGGGIAVYCGTPEGRGFDELGPKGVVIFDTDDFLPHFYPIASRELHEASVDVTGLQTMGALAECAEAALRDIPTRDLVRLVLKGARTLSLRIEEELLSLRYKDRFYFFEIVNKTTLAADTEALRLDRSLRGEFIRRVLADTALSPQQKSDIIDCGLLALSGEEWPE